MPTMLACRIGSNGPSVEMPPRWTTASTPASDAIDRGSVLERRDARPLRPRCGRRQARRCRSAADGRQRRPRRGRSSRPSPPAAPVSRRHLAMCCGGPATGSGDAAAGGGVVTRPARPAGVGPPSAHVLLRSVISRHTTQAAMDDSTVSPAPLAVARPWRGARATSPGGGRRFARRPHPRRASRPRREAADRGGAMVEFGVSRTVVREAMSKLQAAAWSQTRHGIGTFVVGLRRRRPCSASRPSSWRRCRTSSRCWSCASASRPRPPGSPRSGAPTTTCWPCGDCARRVHAGGGGAVATQWARLPVPSGDRAGDPEPALLEPVSRARHRR